METLFNDLLDRYQQFRTFAAWYDVSTNELKTFVENVKARIGQPQPEYQDFPVCVVDCEREEFRRMIRVFEEHYEAGERHRTALFDACEACRFELKRLIDNFNADQQKISQCTDIIEQLVADWAQISGEVNGGENDEHENL